MMAMWQRKFYNNIPVFYREIQDFRHQNDILETLKGLRDVFYVLYLNLPYFND